MMWMGGKYKENHQGQLVWVHCGKKKRDRKCWQATAANLPQGEGTR